MNKRTLSLASAGLFGVLVLGLPARALEEPDQMIVVKDATTGQLRAPTADEIAALQAAKLKANPALAAKQRAVADGRLNLQVKRHRSGAVGARSIDELASYSVVTKGADGQLTEACVESRSAAEAAVQNGVVPAKPVPQQFTEK